MLFIDLCLFVVLFLCNKLWMKDMEDMIIELFVMEDVVIKLFVIEEEIRVR